MCSFLFGQFLSGLTAAMFLFLIASGLSLIFGVLRVLNFAHGSFYMVGAYLAWQIVRWVGPRATVSGSRCSARRSSWRCSAASIERLLLRHLYGREELYQLLFTYALVLILGDLVKVIWGTQQLSVSRPPSLAGAASRLRRDAARTTISSSCCWARRSRSASGSCCSGRALGRIVRAAALDREMLGALGGNVGWVYTGMFVVGSFLAGLGGALVTPMQEHRARAWMSTSSSRPSSSS